MTDRNTSDAEARGRALGRSLNYYLRGGWISVEARAARRLAKGFASIREQYFDATVKDIERRCGLNLSPKSVGGDAELAMKGYQQWCTVRSTVVSSHIREAVRNDRRLFTELSYHMDPDPAINEYFLQFNKERDNQEAQMELLGWKVFEYAGGEERDPVALVVIMRFLPILCCNTWMVIADTFHDLEMLVVLEAQMTAIRQELTSTPGIG